MQMHPDTEKAKARIQHIIECRNGEISRGLIDSCLQHIKNNTGSPTGAMRLLKSHAEAAAMASWYETGDLSTFKNWLYTRCKLEYSLMNEPYNEIGSSQAYIDRALSGMWYLLSDNEELIDWYSNFDKFFDKKRVEDVKKADFWTKQFFIALRGEWNILIERCERILANPPTNTEKRFLIDHQFYLALGKGDVAGMESVIQELVTQKMISNRLSIEGGFSEGLICSPAIIYCKLAWRWGYQIAVDSPYIPREWIRVAPLNSYSDFFCHD